MAIGVRKNIRRDIHKNSNASGRTIVDGSGPASQAVRKVFNKTLEILNGLGDEDDE
jgi:hypothetical protein